MRNYVLALMTATALISSAALAQTPASANGIAVLSGGVGYSDRAHIEAQQGNYALKLVFSGQGGAFLSGVNVTLADRAGNVVLSTITDGPILLANPPAGTYKMTAMVEGLEKTLNVTAGKKPKTYQISFPISDDAELTDADGTYRPQAATPYTAPTPGTGYVPVAPMGYQPRPAYPYAPAPYNAPVEYYAPARVGN